MAKSRGSTGKPEASKPRLRTRVRRVGISQARKPVEFGYGDANRFLRGLIRGRSIVEEHVFVPQLKYSGRALPHGHVITRYKPGTPVDPRVERRGEFELARIISRPPNSRIVPRSEGFDSRHHVFELRHGPVAVKYFIAGDEAFAPGFAQREATNLTFFRKGLLIPAVRPLRVDISARYDRNSRRWVPNHQWARLFTEMPHGHISVNRLDFDRMSREQRGRLLEELGFAVGQMHRNRGVHGDLTLANILIRHPEWVTSPFSIENITHLDVESAGYAGQKPDKSRIRDTFVDDVRVLSEDTRRLGLVKEDEEDLLRDHFWKTYRARWWAGRPSRIARSIDELGPETFFKRIPKESEGAAGGVTAEKAAETMADRLYERLGIMDDNVKRKVEEMRRRTGPRRPLDGD